MESLVLTLDNLDEVIEKLKKTFSISKDISTRNFYTTSKKKLRELVYATRKQPLPVKEGGQTIASNTSMVIGRGVYKRPTGAELRESGVWLLDNSLIKLGARDERFYCLNEGDTVVFGKNYIAVLTIDAGINLHQRHFEVFFLN